MSHAFLTFWSVRKILIYHLLDCVYLGEEIIAYKPPGFSLMYHLLNESPMLELALSLLEEGVKQLDTYAPFPGMCLHVLCLKKHFWYFYLL